ncbi:MAG: hypothetical protein GY703_17660 [Gammaproteobacteria bacterium]|nr:hypothetical protein [Gammaproteobacteria bacterium]
MGPTIEAVWEAADEASALVGFDKALEDWKTQLFFEIDGAVTTARAGIAATGTLILWPTPAEPRTMSLVPPVHFAVLAASSLYDTFDAAPSAKGWVHGMPSNALLISGPSRTADIEQTLTYGIHGPMELVVLLIE